MIYQLYIKQGAVGAIVSGKFVLHLNKYQLYTIIKGRLNQRKPCDYAHMTLAAPMINLALPNSTSKNSVIFMAQIFVILGENFVEFCFRLQF